MILAFIISFVIPVKRARPIRGSALVHIIFIMLCFLRVFPLISLYNEMTVMLIMGKYIVLRPEVNLFLVILLLVRCVY